MTTQEEINEFLLKQREALKNPVTVAFLKFKNALIRAWIMDTEDSFTDKNRSSTIKAHETANKLERELRALIEKSE